MVCHLLIMLSGVAISSVAANENMLIHPKEGAPVAGLAAIGKS